MAIQAELYDGTVLEFPDGTDPKVIEQVARRETVRKRTQSVKGERYSAAGTATENVLAGAGKAFVDIGRGVRQIGAQLGNAAGLVDDSTVAAYQAEIDESRQRDADLMRTGGGVVGNIAGNIAATVAPAGLLGKAAQAVGMGRTAAALNAVAAPKTYGSAIASGAAVGAVQPTATGESRIQNAAVGGAFGAAGNAAANVVGRVAQPVKRALSPTDAKQAEVLRRAGVELDVAQSTGSKAAQQVKRFLGDNPFTAPVQADVLERQQSQFNRAVLKVVGENADAATPDVLDNAFSRVGKVFDDIAARNQVRVDGQLRTHLSKLRADAGKELVEGEAGVIAQNIDEILGKGGGGFGAIDGQAYQNLVSRLGRLSRSANGPLKMYAAEMREALDDALTRQAGVQERAALNEARRQYRALLQIENAVDVSTGSISPAKLANQFANKANRRQGLRGKGDQQLVNLAKAGKRFLRDPFPNSGTTARAALQLVPGVGLGVGTGLVTGDWESAAKVGAAAYAAPKAAQYLLSNPAAANYLSQGMAQGLPRNALVTISQSSLPRLIGAGASPALR